MDKVPCPVEGCTESFKDEAEAAKHLKEKHRAAFTPPGGLLIPDKPDESDKFLSMLPPGILDVLDKRMDDRIQSALVSERPETAKAVKGAIEEVIKNARAAGLSIPGVADTPIPGKDGEGPDSPVTPAGLSVIQALLRPEQKTDMENMAAMLTQARAISDILNPPSMWDKVMQNVVVRSLKGGNLLTDKEAEALIKE